MTNNMYKLGNTYIGKHGIYNTAPVKQVNPTRWATITYDYMLDDGETIERTKTINCGCVKERELMDKAHGASSHRASYSWRRYCVCDHCCGVLLPVQGTGCST